MVFERKRIRYKIDLNDKSPEKIENMHVIKINNQVPVKMGKDYYFTYEEQFGKNKILVDLYKYYGAPGQHLLYAYTQISAMWSGFLQGSNSITIYPRR